MSLLLYLNIGRRNLSSGPKDKNHFDTLIIILAQMNLMED